MRRIAAAVLMTVIVAGAGAAPGPLARERWRHRVVLVFAPAEDDPALARQRESLATAHNGLRERDARVVEVIGERAPSDLDGAALRAAFDPGGAFAVVLVGKDGGVKLRDDRPISAELLFRAIDAMPMARDEAARRSGPRRSGP
jgi:hypothetical protein